MDKLGEIIRQKRLSKNETIEDMANAIKCSVGFARHIEMSPTMPISDRLIQNLIAHFKIPKELILDSASERKLKGQEYRIAFNKKHKIENPESKKKKRSYTKPPQLNVAYIPVLFPFYISM